MSTKTIYSTLKPGQIVAAFKSRESKIIKQLVRDRLNDPMNSRKISPQELADSLDVSLATIYRWWKGDDKDPIVVIYTPTQAMSLIKTITKLEDVVAQEDVEILQQLKRQLQ